MQSPVLLLFSDVIDVEAIIHGNLCDVGLLFDLIKVRGYLLSFCSSFGLFCLRGSFGLLLCTCSLSFGELLSLSFLLALNELTLRSLSVSFLGGLLFLLGCCTAGIFSLLGSVSVLGAIIFLLAVLGRLQVLDEVGKKWSHRVLCLPIEQNGVFIHTQLLCVPVDKELIVDKLVVVELVAQSGGKFLQL